MKTTLTFSIIILFQSFICSQVLTTDELIEKSISFHDPNNNWDTFEGTLKLRQDNPKDTKSYRKVYLNLETGEFKFKGSYGENTLKYLVQNGQGQASWNDNSSIPDSIKTKYRISPSRALMYRNYYEYLYGMPMKLKDKGTNIDPTVKEVHFHGGDYYKIKVSYDIEVGTDTWYFYFEKDNYALGAYEFWKKTPGDGEYMLLSGIKQMNGINMPQRISWFMTVDDRWLGMDVLE